MKADSPSKTAQLVALGRAMADAGLSHVAGFSDPTARLLISDKSRKALEKTETAIRSGQKSMRLAYARVMADMMALRTTMIDTALRGAIARGAKQLVILGAGYDGRAWRMQELSGVKVFEVDHPATQSDKKSRTSRLPTAIGDVTFVPMDFEKSKLRDALTRAGHNPAIPTAWIWEGVVMYLTKPAMRATLEAMAELSAPGSTVIVNYHAQNRRWFARLIFRLIGEPMISAWSPEEMSAELESAGFNVIEDLGLGDWNAKWASGQANVSRALYMRVAVGVRA